MKTIRHGRLRHGWEDNIKMDIQEVGVRARTGVGSGIL
jgi:hypothetical protein